MSNLYMLWRCGNAPVDVSLACRHYEEKYRQRPNVCRAHPDIALANTDELTVLRDQHVLPFDIWLGVEDGQQNECNAG